MKDIGGSTVGTEARSDMHSLRAKLYIGAVAVGAAPSYS